MLPVFESSKGGKIVSFIHSVEQLSYLCSNVSAKILWEMWSNKSIIGISITNKGVVKRVIKNIKR